MGPRSTKHWWISKLPASTACLKLILSTAMYTLTQCLAKCESESIQQCEGNVTVWQSVSQWKSHAWILLTPLRQGAAIMTGGDTSIFRCNCSFSYLPSKITRYCYVWKPSPLCKITVYQMGVVSWPWFSVEYFTAVGFMGNIHFCSSVSWLTGVIGFSSLLILSFDPAISDF